MTQPSLSLLILATLLGAPAYAQEPSYRYDVEFRVTLEPETGSALAMIDVNQDGPWLITLTMRLPVDRFTVVDSVGETSRDGDHVTWRVPPGNGSVSYRYKIDQVRGNGRFDARITNDFALFRADDLFPKAHTRIEVGSRSHSALSISAPLGWAVETAYGSAKKNKLPFANPKRKFDRPKGWIIAGELGVRRERIAGRIVTVAAPKGHGMRRNDIIAFLNWNLPDLIDAIGDFPERLLIVGAGPEFWRGGLSAPRSFYLHPSRPLISEDGTSTLLHELVHVGTKMSAQTPDDWIVEGIAEFYSLEVMRRSGTLSEARFERALAHLTNWGREAKSLQAERSSGPITARAAVAFHALDREIREATAGKASLDDVVSRLRGIVSEATLDRIVEETKHGTAPPQDIAP